MDRLKLRWLGEMAYTYHHFGTEVLFSHFTTMGEKMELDLLYCKGNGTKSADVNDFVGLIKLTTGIEKPTILLDVWSDIPFLDSACKIFCYIF